MFKYCSNQFRLQRVKYSPSILSDYRLDDRGWIPGRGKGFLLSAFVSRPTLGLTQPPVKWVPGVLSAGLKRSRGVTLTTHPHLVARSRMCRSYVSSPPWRLHGGRWIFLYYHHVVHPISTHKTLMTETWRHKYYTYVE
jgi:hypothetical protein